MLYVFIQLHKYCFTNVDALDASAEMLAIARKKNVYKHLMEATLGPQRLDIPDGR